MATPDFKLEDLAPEDRYALPYNHPLLDHYAERVGATLGLPRGLVNAIKNVGERSNSDQVSEAQAMGVMQIIPSTQKLLGVTDPRDPLQSIRAGAQYLADIKRQRKTDDPLVLAAAYHAGPDSAPARGEFKGSPRTQAYAERVAAAMKAQAPAASAPRSAGEMEDIRPEDMLPADREKLLRSPNNPDWHPPTEGNSFLQNAAIGAGKMLSDTGSGLRQVGAAVLNPLAQKLVGKDVLAEDYEGEKERKALDAPLMDTWGGNLGYAGAGAATLALPGGVALQTAKLGMKALPWVARAAPAVAKLAPVAASSGALSTLTPTTEEGERGKNAATAAVLGPAFEVAGQGALKVARPAVEWVGRNVNLGPLLRKSWSSGATAEQKQAVKAALDNDVPVYGSQLDKPDSELGRGRTAEQLEALTRGFNRTMGAETSNIPGAIADTTQRLSGVYKSVLDNKNIQLGQPWANQVTALRNQYQAAVPMRRPNAELMDAFQRAEQHGLQGGSLTGRQYQDMLREYAGAARLALKGNGDTVVSDPVAARAYSHLADLLELQASKRLTGAELAAFKQANKQFRNMKTLESVSPVSLEGDYNPSQVARKLARSDPGAFFLNRGDTTQADLAKFGATYMGMGPNTPPRTLIKQAKQMGKNMAPYILTGVGEGALIGSQVDHSGEPGMLQDAALYGVPILASMAGVAAAKRGMNPRLTAQQLKQPRGALAELTRHSRLAPSAAALIGAQREEEE